MGQAPDRGKRGGSKRRPAWLPKGATIVTRELLRKVARTASTPPSAESVRARDVLLKSAAQGMESLLTPLRFPNAATKPTSRSARRGDRPGRPPGLSNEEFLECVRTHPARPDWIGSDGERAQLLTASLGRLVTHDQVRRARERLGLPPARNTTRNAE